MGSMSKANLSGFVCRACSRIDIRSVHLYCEKATRLKILSMVNKMLCLNISPKDKLPKTVCSRCMVTIFKQRNFMRLVHKAQAQQMRKRAKIEKPSTT